MGDEDNILIYETTDYKVFFHSPHKIIKTVNYGYYLDDQDHLLGSQCTFYYTNCYNPTTLQLKDITEGKLMTPTTNIYGYDPYHNTKELIYDCQQSKFI